MAFTLKTTFAVFMALTAYTLLSLGFVMQKKGIAWMGWKGPKEKSFYKNQAVWTGGFIIMNIYGVPSAIALKTLPAHIVSAFAGWGIIMLVLFSFLILKEKMLPHDYLFAFLIVAGIFLLGLFERPAPQTTGSTTGLAILCGLPVLVFAAMLPKWWSKRVKTAGYASVSGMGAGLMVVSLGLLVFERGYRVAAYFSSPYLYIYIFFALLSLAGLQLALKNGEMIAVGPVQYGSTIIYPVIANLLVFDRLVHPVQAAAIVLIVVSVIRILKKH
jgi:drug/metabolite transporter (DMT)-like permease